MRILVTGATGFIGRHLVSELSKRHEVVALVRRLPDGELPAVKTIVTDLGSPTFQARLPRDLDAVVHLAQAYKTFPEHAAEILAVNTSSTQRLADHARSAGVRRFVLASSGSVYGHSAHPLTEGDRPNPSGFHPATKLMAEQLLGYYRDPLEVLSLRLFAPYGPGQVDRLIPRLVDSVRSGRPITISRGGEPRMQPIFIDDLVSVMVDAIEGSMDGVINVAGPKPMSIRDMVEVAAAILGRDPVLIERDQPPFGDLIADVAAMEAAFGKREMIDFADGLQRTVAS